MTTDTDLAELAKRLHRENAERGARAILAREPEPAPRCRNCRATGRPLRLWPFGEVSIFGNEVCPKCWTTLARGEVVCRCQGNGRLAVYSTHPQYGELFRGTIRAVGIEPRGFQPVTRWAIADQDSHDLGEYIGDYADAEARLLAATAWADEIENDQSNDEED